MDSGGRISTNRLLSSFAFKSKMRRHIWVPIDPAYFDFDPVAANTSSKWNRLIWQDVSGRIFYRVPWTSKWWFAGCELSSLDNAI